MTLIPFHESIADAVPVVLVHLFASRGHICVTDSNITRVLSLLKWLVTCVREQIRDGEKSFIYRGVALETTTVCESCGQQWGIATRDTARALAIMKRDIDFQSG